MFLDTSQLSMESSKRTPCAQVVSRVGSGSARLVHKLHEVNEWPMVFPTSANKLVGGADGSARFS